MEGIGPGVFEARPGILLEGLKKTTEIRSHNSRNPSRDAIFNFRKLFILARNCLCCCCALFNINDSRSW
jgi:hypothetical protein